MSAQVAVLLALHFGANTLIILIAIFAVVGLGESLDLEPDGDSVSPAALALTFVVMLLFGWIALLAWLFAEARSEP